jgi:hypothetical protein
VAELGLVAAALFPGPVGILVAAVLIDAGTGLTSPLEFPR